MTIRSQLLLVMVIALFIATSLVGGVQMYTSYYQARQNMQNILQNQANQFSNQVETWFTIIKQNGHFFVSESFVQQANQEEMQKLLGNMHNELNVFDNLIVATPDGIVTNVYPYDGKIIGQSIMSYDYFRDTVNSKAPQISPVIINDSTSKIVIGLTQPIVNHKGELTAVLVQNIKLDLLYDMVEDAKIGKTGQTMIFTADGKVIAPQNNKVEGRISVIPEAVMNIFKKDLRSVGQFKRDDGSEIMAATIRVKTPGWGVVVTVPQEEVLQSFYNGVKYGVVAFCVIFFLLAFVASLVFNRLFRSITVVTEQFASINEENFVSTKISEELMASAPQELRKLCGTFNKMLVTIQNNIEIIKKNNDQLELKVELRTQDLLAMNEELKAVNDELGQTLETLQQTQTQLIESEKMASLGNLVAGVAHEINTPVGVGVTATSHLQKITKDFLTLYEGGELRRQDLKEYLAESQEATTIIFANLERASLLIQSFKQVSVDQSSEEKRVFNVKHYMGEILVSLQPKLKRTQHKITIDCEDMLEIDSFPGAFGQIITNLIMNSLTHAYDGDEAGNINITIIREQQSELSLIYSDDGKGMPQEIVHKIFNPFFTTKRGMGGTGLGLYILYNIIAQRFGGTIECSSELGKGTMFIMKIPLS